MAANNHRSWLGVGFLTGLTIMAPLVAEGTAYSVLASVPPKAAIFAAPIGLTAALALDKR